MAVKVVEKDLGKCCYKFNDDGIADADLLCDVVLLTTNLPGTQHPGAGRWQHLPPRRRHNACPRAPANLAYPCSLAHTRTHAPAGGAPPARPCDAEQIAGGPALPMCPLPYRLYSPCPLSTRRPPGPAVAPTLPEPPRGIWARSNSVNHNDGALFAWRGRRRVARLRRGWSGGEEDDDDDDGTKGLPSPSPRPIAEAEPPSHTDTLAAHHTSVPPKQRDRI